MKSLRHCSLFLFCAAVAVWLSVLAGRADQSTIVEPKFDVLKTRTGTYTNVTVTTRAAKYIYILHATGMTSIRISDLPPSVREELGYAPPPDGHRFTTNRIATAAARELAQANQDLKPIAAALQQKWQTDKSLVQFNSQLIATAIAVALVIHMFFSYCYHLICIKARAKASVLVWLPVFQMIPLLRAAGMSGWWFLAMFVPILNVLPAILWCVNIVKARDKNIIWAILLILPVTSLFAILYLAFSSAAGEDKVTPSRPTKFQTRSLGATA